MDKFNVKIGKFGSSINQQFSVVKQFASEKLGSADPECVTELPQEYLVLEGRIDKIRILYESMLKLSKNLSSSDYDSSVNEMVRDAVDRFNAAVSNSPAHLNGEEKLKQAKTLGHALARSASFSATQLGDHEPLGAALKLFSAAQDKVGNARLELENDVVSKFVRPWSATLNVNIQAAMKSRKQVSLTRLNLDAAKGRAKNVSKTDGKFQQIQNDLLQAEQEFNAALRDAMEKMSLVCDSPEPLRNLGDLVNCQITFYKQAGDALQNLSPQLEELQLTQEALFRK